MKCPNCGSRDIDFQEAGGQSVCMGCGTVVEESTIVSSIEFQVIFFALRWRWNFSTEFCVVDAGNW